MHFLGIQIISPEVTVQDKWKIIVNSLLPKSLWLEFHRQHRTIPACNCRGTDRRKMKVKEMPFSLNLPLGVRSPPTLFHKCSTQKNMCCRVTEPENGWFRAAPPKKIGIFCPKMA